MTIAIDPGVSGGIAIFRPKLHAKTSSDPFSAYSVIPMPKHEDDTIAHIAILTAEVEPDEQKSAWIEDVNGYMGNAMPGSRMFTFGDNCGFVRGALKAFGWDVETVTPQVWQKGVGVTKTRGMKKAEWKRRLLEEAKRNFPTLKGITLKTCDALLILEWAITPF